MQTIHLPSTQPLLVQQPIVMALGFFDGLHIGHCEVIHRARDIARERQCTLAVMSFFPHPKSVLSNGAQSVDYLMPLCAKERYLQSLGVDLFVVVQFDWAFASLSPETFVEQYLVNLGVIHVVAGFDYSYGRKGAGHLGRMREDSGGLLTVTEVGKVAYPGGKISSTCIREKIREGKVEEVPVLLGRHYEVQGVWEEDWIRIDPYYLLPAKGTYQAVVRCNGILTQMELIVSNEADAVYLPEMERMRVRPGESVTISWQRKLSKERFYSYGLLGASSF